MQFGPLTYATRDAQGGGGGSACCTRAPHRQYLECRAADIELPRGTITAVLGGSGAGKTLLLELLAGRVTPTTGDVQAAGSSAGDVAVAYVGEHPPLLAHLTVGETVAFAVAMRGEPNQAQHCADMLAALHMEHLERTPVERLSMGQRQRLALAEALCGDPQVLIADAATTAMTTPEQQRIMRLLRDLATRGCTVVLAINRPPARIESQVDQIVLLSAGRLICAGAPAECLAFLVEATGDEVLAKHPAPFDYALSRAGRASAQFQDHLMPANAAPAASATPATHRGTSKKEGYQKVALDDHDAKGATAVNSLELEDIRDDVLMERLDDFESDTDEQLDAFAAARLAKKTAAAAAAAASDHKTNGIAAGDEKATIANGHDTTDTTDTRDRRSWTTMGLQGAFAQHHATKSLRRLQLGVGAGPDNAALSLPPPPPMQGKGADTKGAGCGTQFTLLLWRWYATSMRAGAEMRSMLFGLLACSLVMAVVWTRTNRGQLQATYQVLLLLFLTLLFTSLIPHAKVSSWIAHREVFDKEMAARTYSVPAYVCAQTLWSTLELAVLGALFTLPVYASVFRDADGSQLAWAYAFVMLHMLAHSAVVETFAFATGRQAQSHMYAINGAAFSVLFAGFLVPRLLLPDALRWLSQLSYTQYAFSGLVRVFFHRGGGGGSGGMDGDWDLLDDILDVATPDATLPETLFAMLLMTTITRLVFVLVVAFVSTASEPRLGAPHRLRRRPFFICCRSCRV